MTREDAYKLNTHVTGKMQSIRWNKAVDIIVDGFESREKKLLAEIEKLKLIRNGKVLPTKEMIGESFDYKDGNLVWKVNRGLAKKGKIAVAIRKQAECNKFEQKDK